MSNPIHPINLESVKIGDVLEMKYSYAPEVYQMPVVAIGDIELCVSDKSTGYLWLIQIPNGLEADAEAFSTIAVRRDGVQIL